MQILKLNLDYQDELENNTAMFSFHSVIWYLILYTALQHEYDRLQKQ